MVEITLYEESLVIALKEFHIQQSNLSDFTIICQDGIQIQSYKLLLSARSKYFEALFR